MRFRTYALLVLALVGLIPLAAFGLIAMSRAEQTAVAEVRGGNQLLADAVARRIDGHIQSERELLHTLGLAILQAKNPDLALNDFSIQFRNLHEIAVYDAAGAIAAGPRGAVSADVKLVAARALAGAPASAPVRPPATGKGGPFAHTIVVGEPLVLAGEPAGAVVARVDLMTLWKPVNQVRVGRSGFVRLVTREGVLLAHGDPEERRYAFSDADNRDIVARARRGETIVNQQGVESFAAVAPVGGNRGWSIVVEQPVEQALGAVAAMKRSLLVLVAGTILIAVVAAYFAGRKAVRGIETLGDHTRVLASGKLDAVVDLKSGLSELDRLAVSMNEMASSLASLHDDARRRERLTTFGRVAAGLTHDLRHPIESVRTACESLAAHREDEDAWELFDFMRQKELPKLKKYLEDLRRLTAEGSVSLSLSHIEPREMLDDIAADLRSSPKWRGVSFAVDVNTMAIDGDENLLRRAVYNLAANAADACVVNGRGGEVVLEAAAGGDAEVKLRVRDNGPGMSPETLQRVMSGEFHSTKRSNGIGLGVGVARHVAQLHGGRMEAMSEPGSGTTFTLALPRLGEEPSAGESRAG